MLLPLVRPFRLASLLLVWIQIVAAGTFQGQGAPPPDRWWKGNLHTHSLWSDGDDFPEQIARWYRDQGYHFLALSDHNTLLAGEKWTRIDTAVKREALDKYLAAFGADWVQRREVGGRSEVRLRTLAEIQPLLEKRGRFLLIPSEEITDQYRSLPIHMNASNIRDLIRPQGGTNVADAIQRNLEAVLAQRQRTGQPMMVHLNHPNFGWAITAEDMLAVRGDRFVEIYNGHPMVHNEGSDARASMERVWDILLAFRLSRLGLGPLYGLAVDDSHNYHQESSLDSNPGRGWVMVRSPDLEAGSLISALESGEFYASSGVTLRELSRGRHGIDLVIEPEPGVTYTTTFIGTLRDFDPTSQPGPRVGPSARAVTRIYSGQIGSVLGVAEGNRASYRFVGDELYVRARVVSSRLKANPYLPGEFETAWVQPVILQSNLHTFKNPPARAATPDVRRPIR